MINYSNLLPQIELLFKQAQLSHAIFSIENCKQGGNNQTFKVKTTDGLFIVKKYFRQEGDKRDRLTSEFSFLKYAKQSAPDFVPAAYSFNNQTGMALYEFIDGEVFHGTSSITIKEIDQAIHFFCQLNQAKIKSQAIHHLPLASEACFSIAEHLNLISLRIQQLKDAVLNQKEERKAHDFMRLLDDYWQNLVKKLQDDARDEHVDLSAVLNWQDRCISPSDFGFHNALRTKKNICFLDFEYAGWDDPAKMSGDFFSQLAVPISSHYFDYFIQSILNPFQSKNDLITRARLLKSIYEIKWCCIALNIFIPVHLARRSFANPNLDQIEAKQKQLEKAQLLFSDMEKNYAAN